MKSIWYSYSLAQNEILQLLFYSTHSIIFNYIRSIHMALSVSFGLFISIVKSRSRIGYFTRDSIHCFPSISPPPPFLSFPFLSFASVHLSLCAFHTMLCLLLPRTIGIPTGPSQSPVLIPRHIKSRASNFFCLGSYFPGRSLHFTKVKLRGFESFVSFAQHLNTLLRLLIHTF